MTTALDHRVPEWTTGDRMRKAMEDRGYSVASAALRFGVGRNTISNWIHGHTTPPPIAVEVWADWTGVPLSWLQTGVVPSGGDGPAHLDRHFGHADGFGRLLPFRAAAA